MLLRGVADGRIYGFRWTMVPGIEFALGGDANAVLFVTLSTVLWFLTTFYAIGYLEGSPHRGRFFAFTIVYGPVRALYQDERKKRLAYSTIRPWVALVLAAGSLLNAAYFLPILYRAYFCLPPEKWPAERSFGKWETHWMLLVPTLATAAVVVLAGVFAESPFSPLSWVKIIMHRE